MKHVIHIFGPSGAGTTTLGRLLCDTLGWQHMDTDDYFWLPTEPKFTQKRPREARIALMEADLDRANHAVVSGSVADWGLPLLPRFTLAVRIELAQELRIARLIAREQQRYGDRIAPGGDMYRRHREFVEWARGYETGGPDMRSRARHDLWEQHFRCPILRLDGAETPQQHLQKVLQALEAMT